MPPVHRIIQAALLDAARQIKHRSPNPHNQKPLIVRHKLEERIKLRAQLRDLLRPGAELIQQPLRGIAQGTGTNAGAQQNLPDAR